MTFIVDAWLTPRFPDVRTSCVPAGVPSVTHSINPATLFCEKRTLLPIAPSTYPASFESCGPNGVTTELPASVTYRLYPVDACAIQYSRFPTAVSEDGFEWPDPAVTSLTIPVP